jgi:hypothetical protein
LQFAYAGPVMGVIAWNAIGSLIGVVCIYAFLNKEKFKRNKFIYKITKPFHKIIKRIARNRLDSNTR